MDVCWLASHPSCCLCIVQCLLKCGGELSASESARVGISWGFLAFKQALQMCTQVLRSDSHWFHLFLILLTKRWDTFSPNYFVEKGGRGIGEQLIKIEYQLEFSSMCARLLSFLPSVQPHHTITCVLSRFISSLIFSELFIKHTFLFSVYGWP